jgi:hypothetical protein
MFIIKYVIMIISMALLATSITFILMTYNIKPEFYYQLNVLFLCGLYMIASIMNFVGLVYFLIVKEIKNEHKNK